MNRREFIAGLGSAVAWPIAARAQQGERMRRIGVLMNSAEDDPDSQARLTALRQALQELGWTDSRNLLIEYRWGAADVARARNLAVELVTLAPDVILVIASPAVTGLQQVTRTVPIVFVNVVDPVGAGFVASLARPGGNTTGFTAFEYSLSGKWLEMLKQITPGVTRVAVFRDPAISSGIGQFAVIQAVAPSFGVELTPYDTRDAGEIEGAFTAIARGGLGGVIVTASGTAAINRNLIVGLVARHRLPAIHSDRSWVTAGGMISYGPDLVEGFRRAASYLDRILRGEKPADLPVQNPTKYELVINLKTAKALGLAVPQSILLRADEVIE
jgi:putative tryptophan/tyrosine transport system substrate-binding protein